MYTDSYILCIYVSFLQNPNSDKSYICSYLTPCQWEGGEIGNLSLSSYLEWEVERDLVYHLSATKMWPSRRWWKRTAPAPPTWFQCRTLPARPLRTTRFKIQDSFNQATDNHQIKSLTPILSTKKSKPSLIWSLLHFFLYNQRLEIFPFLVL